jgi:hypothetical protein
MEWGVKSEGLLPFIFLTRQVVLGVTSTCTVAISEVVMLDVGCLQLCGEMLLTCWDGRKYSVIFRIPVRGGVRAFMKGLDGHVILIGRVETACSGLLLGKEGFIDWSKFVIFG